jgi:hypothetical protein
MNPRIISVVGVLLGGALLIFGAYQAIRLAMSSRPAPPKQLSLVDYLGDETTKVTLTALGPVEADEEHASVTISVTRSNRQLQVVKTYGGTAVINEDYPNNATAFEDFMRALQLAGFLRTRSGTPSELGQCPRGQRYVYELIHKNRSVVRSWSSTCSKDGTFAGTPGTVQSLFREQVPDYAKTVRPAGKIPSL